MSGFWLASYLVLWIVVACLALLLVGALRQIGMLHLQVHGDQTRAADPDLASEESIPPLEEDGPPIGTTLPAWAEVSAEGEQPPESASLASSRTTLLMFLSPLCDTCQNVVEPLNALEADTTRAVRTLAIFRADRPAYEAFLKLFPLHTQSLRDSDRTLTIELGVHRAPFGLLYDEHDILIRKGLIEGEEDLAALLGDEGVSESARTHVYPRVRVTAE
ncbi:MAG TPA: hypothetical protein VF120_16140 [Ktedonobacterales bacterium]